MRASAGGSEASSCRNEQIKFKEMSKSEATHQKPRPVYNNVQSMYAVHVDTVYIVHNVASSLARSSLFLFLLACCETSCFSHPACLPAFVSDFGQVIAHYLLFIKSSLKAHHFTLCWVTLPSKLLSHINTFIDE